MPLARRGLIAATALTFALMASASRVQAQDYEIKLVRPPRVGQKYSLTVEGAMVRAITIKIEGQQDRKRNEGYGVRLEGTVEVLAVNSDGEEAKAACTVTKCVRIVKEGEQELVPAGRVVTAEGVKTDTNFTVDKGELPDETKEALRLVFRMGEEDGFNDDKIYGTTTRQAVGGTWQVDAKAASEEAKADDVLFDPADVSGSLTLEKVEQADGVECLRIAGPIEIKKLTAEPPANMTFESGSLKGRYSGLFPVDGSTGVLGETQSVTYHTAYRGKNPAGQEVVIDSKMQRATEMTRKFLP